MAKTKRAESNTARLSPEAGAATLRHAEVNRDLAELHKEKARLEARIIASMNGKRFGVYEGMCFEAVHRVTEYTTPATPEALDILLASGLEFSKRYPARKKAPILRRIDQ